jgi:hypothetical protein
MTGTRTAKMLLALFFAGLLATPVVLKQMSERQRVAAVPDAKAAALSRYGFFLEEVSHSAGIDFVHHHAGGELHGSLRFHRRLLSRRLA